MVGKNDHTQPEYGERIDILFNFVHFVIQWVRIVNPAPDSGQDWLFLPAQVGQEYSVIKENGITHLTQCRGEKLSLNTWLQQMD